MGRAWLLERAHVLEAEGQHDLAAQARAEADAEPTPAPALVRSVPCEECGRPVGILRNMRDDWPLDWWSHRLNGTPCR